MSDLSKIFNDLEKLLEVSSENLMEVMKFVLKDNFNLEHITKKEACNKYDFLINYFKKLISVLDILILKLTDDENIMISVKNRKLLRDSYELLATLGISRCLVPGLGISVDKRQPCKNPLMLEFILKSEYKYLLLKFITELFQRSYQISALKSIIISYHLCDFLAALIQLGFYRLDPSASVLDDNTSQSSIDIESFRKDRDKFQKGFYDIIENCFQPLVFKELLVLQSFQIPPMPRYIKKMLSNETSKRLTAPMGLTSLIRCLMDCHSTDTGVAWSKISVVCNIVAAKHTHMLEIDYFKNILSQLKEVLTLDSSQYLNMGVASLLTLNLRYPNQALVQNMVDDVFNTLNFDKISKCELPNTIILTPQQIKQSINIFKACTIIMERYYTSQLILPNLYMLFLLRIKCTKKDTKSVISDIIIRNLEVFLETDEFENIVERFLLGTKQSTPSNVLIEEYEAGLLVKCSAYPVEHPTYEAITNFLEIFNSITNNNRLVGKLFELCFKLFAKLNSARNCRDNYEILTSEEQEAKVLKMDETYIQLLHLLAEMSATESVTNALKEFPEIVVYFVESLLFGDMTELDEECSTIALVLLNTVLPDVNKSEEVETRLRNLVPVLKKLSEFSSEHTRILCTESISWIETNRPKYKDSDYQIALSYAVDDLLPVRAHGIIELTKLLENSDAEAISRRHFLFCLFQDQLKDSDSYLYLAAINGLAALTMCCPDESLEALCKEFLSVTNEKITTSEQQNKITETRLKIGEIIMKVIRKLGEIAVVHKVVLINTMLCACRDDDPFIRTSALSNIAEMAMVMNYRLGTIIFEILKVIWDTIETEKVLECRRAAVMVIGHLFKGFGKEILVQLQEVLLPIYKTLNRIYKDTNEDSVVKLHAQLAIEELDDIVRDILNPELPFEPIRNLK